MKIVLANLPWHKFGRTGVRAGSRWPHLRNSSEANYLPFPFFLAYSSALLKKHSFDVVLIDAIVEKMSYSYFLKLIKKINPRLLFCETSTVTLEHDLRLLNMIDKNIAVALGGPDVNMRQPAFLKKHRFIDYVIIGEYESTLVELASNLETNKSPKGISGLIYRDKNIVVVNSLRPLISLDELPWPLREDLPMERYNDTPGDMPLPSVQMLASRGCPYRCKFCLWPQVMYQGNNYRTRNTVDVVDEMEYLVREKQFKSIYFDDDTFNIGKQRMLKLCGEINRRKLNIPWAIMARADLMDEEILDNMKGAGLFAIKYGVESATQELLDGISKNMDIKKTVEIIKFTKMLGIKTHLTFTFGLPGETKETVLRTVELALKLDPESAQFSITTPFPGTIFYEDMKKKGYIISEKWSEYDGNNKSVIFTDNLTKKDLESAVTFGYKQWLSHCLNKRKLKRTTSKGYYFQLLFSSLKKFGIFRTLFKTVRFVLRNLVMFFRDRLEDYRGYGMGIEIAKEVVKIGRLSLIFVQNGINLHWNGIKLTRGTGFFSSVKLQNGKSHQSSMGCWDFERINNAKFSLKTKYGILPMQEMWLIEIIDEKQIDWHVDVYTEEDLGIKGGNFSLILSQKYKKWIDSWGEEYFPPIDDCIEVELRNKDTSFIGLRGRKRLKGQLPTILLDISSNNGDFFPYAKNATLPLSARMVGARLKILNDSDSGNFIAGKKIQFSGRIKIVEEDFNKNKHL